MPDLLATAPHQDQHPSVHYCGTGVILMIDLDSGELVAVPAFCHRWDCPHCGPVRLREAQAKAAAGRPERRITMTIRPRPWLSVRQQILYIRDRWRLMCQYLRRTFGHFEYISFVELTKIGTAHLHVLTRGSYIPQRMLSAEWVKLTGDFKVYIQKAGNSWAAVHEASKYCLKTACQIHEAAPDLPVYTMSRNWILNKDDPDKRPPGSYAFYAFCSLPWADFDALVSDLGGSLDHIPAKRHACLVEFARPPDSGLLEDIISWGHPGERAAVSAIDAFLQDPLYARDSLARNRELDDIARFGPGADWDRVTYGSAIPAPSDVDFDLRPLIEPVSAPLF